MILFKRNYQFIALVVLTTLFTLVNVFNINFLYIKTIYSFSFLSLIPGLLIFKMFRTKDSVTSWEKFCYVVGLSISYLIFDGLILNWLLPLFSIKPLTLVPLLVITDIFVLGMGVLTYFKGDREVKIALKNELTLTSLVFSCSPILFIFLSIIGAISINNHGTVMYTLIAQVLIAIYVLILAISKRIFNKTNIPFSIICLSFSLLCMWALRGSNVSGGDIGLEYYLFEQTKLHGFWSWNFLHDAYNACLSITILPTFLSIFTQIKDEYIFKLFFSIYFSLTPLMVYLISRRYVDKRPAFLASFFFMIQYPFVVWFPMLARQEIALLFFGLIILVQFNENLKQWVKNILFLIFGFSLVVSHYSLAYITLIIFLAIVILRYVSKIKYFKALFANQKFFFSPILVGVLLLFTYIWQFQITDSASNLKQFVAFVTNRGNVKTSAAAQSVINLNPFKNTFTTTQEDVQTYYQSVSYEYSKLSYIHTTGVKSNYNIEPVSLEALPITNTKMFLIEQVSYKIVSVIMKIFLVLGVIYLVCFELRKKKIHPEMIFMTAISLVLLVIIILIPDISLEYNYERLLQQVLFTLSIALLFGAYTTLKFLKSKRIVDFILTILFIIYFFYFIGFFGYFIGGEPSSAILNNSGSNYDLDFTPDTEVYSIKWLSTNYNKSNLVYVDKASERKVIAYGGITKGTKLDILPTTVDKDAYVYLSYSNYVDKIVYELFQGKDITYSLPDQFLNDNKNLIYSNGGSVIYK